MSSELIAPEYELFPNRYRWTVQECAAMVEEGRLVGRYEVLDGEIVNKMGQKPPHASTLTRIVAALTRLFGPTFIRVQLPIVLRSPDNTYTEPEPDVAVTRGTDYEYNSRHPGADDLAIVIEVSDTTIRTDAIFKSIAYARSGVPEYWIVDLAARQIHVRREPIDGQYTALESYGDGEQVSVLGHSDLPIAVADILPPETV
ncbi:MAG TPA: Uma2 family endonuclease [Chthonomonadaceae bacterium]|nr:Uma2 family endonuclease [Chthonomonadaceae bacterium]